MTDAAGRIVVEDLEVGTVYDLGSRALSADEIVAFARDWDPQDFHLDEEVGRSGHFGGLIASGVHTFAVFMRMSVDAVYSRWAIVAGRSITDMVFRRPVRPGMRLTGRLRITAIELTEKRPDRALVSHVGELLDDEGTVVFTVALDAYVSTAAAIEGRVDDDR